LVGAIIQSTNEVGVVRTTVFGIERIAAAIPFALARPRPISPVEVAIRTTLVASLAGGAGQQNGPFGAVAGAKAFGIFVVYKAIEVIIDAVATAVRVAIRT
jgi:hypothetical protein